ncbi:hypothetical protein LXL04_014854 [Taraxacum kok-saghyz]
MINRPGTISISFTTRELRKEKKWLRRDKSWWQKNSVVVRWWSNGAPVVARTRFVGMKEVELEGRIPVPEFGTDFLFWFDWWTEHGDLASRFPRLVALDRRKYCSVAERLDPVNGGWRWKRKPKTREELEDMNTLSDIIRNRQLTSSQDRMTSRLNSEGTFYVSDVRKLIDVFATRPMQNIMVWSPLVPLKANCFLWRVCIGRIPTASALVKRGVTVSSHSCRECVGGLDCDTPKFSNFLKHFYDYSLSKT